MSDVINSWIEASHALCVDFYEGCRKFREGFLNIVNNGGCDYNYFEKTMRILGNVERNVEYLNDVFLRNESEEESYVEASSNVTFSEDDISTLVVSARTKLFIPALKELWGFRKQLKKLSSQNYAGYKKYRVDIIAALEFLIEIEKYIIKLLKVFVNITDEENTDTTISMSALEVMKKLTARIITALMTIQTFGH